MTHKVFLVHGMGEHGEEWAKEVIASLTQMYRRYEKLEADSPIDEIVEFIPIQYDHIFVDLFERFRSDSSDALKLAQDVGAELAGSLVGWLTTAGTGFQWTHAADVLFYRLFSDVRQAVKTHVARQIAEVITAELEENNRAEWSVIAHSLGTAVAHDALDMLWSGREQQDGINPLDPRVAKASVVMMVANVSRLLETVVDVLESFVMPGKPSANDRGCLHFLNCRHELDPFTIPRMFNPLGWPDEETAAQGRYLPVVVSHFHDPNVHGLRHYLMNPAVHIPLFRILAGDQRQKRLITKKAEEDAIGNFPAIGLPLLEAIPKRKQIERIPVSKTDDWPRIKEIWDAYHAAI